MSKSIPKSGTVVFGTETQMDGFLEGMNPGSTVIVKELEGAWQCRWLPGTDIVKYFNDGATSDEEIYFYNEERLWVAIPAFS